MTFKNVNQLIKNSCFSSSAKKLSFKTMTTIIYKSVGDVLNVLKTHQETNVNNLLEIYSNALSTYEREKGPKAYPLIILEGLDGSGKTTVSKRLAALLEAEKWGTPPTSIKHLRDFFDAHKTLRTAYYALGNYIAALEVSLLLKSTPVVMDRYWHSTCAFALAQAVHDNPAESALPSSDNEIYLWPEDLLKPDIVLFLNVSEKVRQERHGRRNTTNTNQEQLLGNSILFRENVVKAYKNMRNPGIEIVNGNLYFNKLLPTIQERIRPFFS